MSMDFTIYLGIYIECDKLYKQIESYKNICVKCTKEYYQGEKFCKECGGEIKNIKIIETQINDFWEELESELDEEMCIAPTESDDKVIYLYNYESGNKYSIDIEQTENIIDLLSMQDIEYLVDQFIKEKQDIIQFFKKYYDDKFRVKYGLITYWS